MIYTISECVATIADCVILFLFLISTLSFKRISLIKKVLSTALAIILLACSISLLNRFFTLEGALISIYFFILFIYSKIVLKGKWWHQFLLVLVALGAIFLVNALISILSSIILKDEYTDLLLMRNPVRIFILVISKISLCCILLLISASIKRSKFFLYPIQTIISIILLISTIVAGSAIEKALLDNMLPMSYATIIMICFVVINALLLYIIFLFSIRNHAVMKQVFLETQLRNSEIKLQESLQWSNSVRTLQHDLNNHLITISEYLKENNVSKALSYIKKISVNNAVNLVFTDTNSPALNAMIDLKRIVCKENNIDLKCYMQTDLPDFDDVSFSIVFGNLFDNAIEAEIREEVKEIRLSVDMFGTNLHKVIQNRISKQVLINGKLPKTSKLDKKRHGIGMNNIIDTVNSRNGAVEFYEQDDWFIADVLLPI